MNLQEEESKYKENEYPFKEGDKVNLTIETETALGYIVLIDDEFDGLLFKSEIFEDLDENMEIVGYIKKIRDDGKVDVTLRPQGFRNVIDTDVEKILDKLKNSRDGFLLLTDKSSPQTIRFHLKMSKKAFKKAIGSLYKKNHIIIEKDKIKLIN